MLERRKSVLIIAYACEPNETSEPGVGWNFSKQVAKSYRTVVLTRKNNREAIESGEGNQSEFIYYDLPSWLMRLKKKTPLGTQWYYALWQWGAYRYAKKYLAAAQEPIDVVHHLNFAMTWLAPPAYLINKPFVWGPIGGGDQIPARFYKDLRFKAKLQEGFYYALNQLGRFSIFSYWTRKKADTIVFRTQSTLDNFPVANSKILRLLSETASVGTEFSNKKVPNTFKAICVGRLLYWKGFIYAVKGFHAFLKSGGEGTLEIFGDGPEEKRITDYIRENDLGKHIFLKGFVDNAIIKAKMNAGSVLLHPSFRDGGSWSIMEAMSLGMPVICLDTSGPKDMVTERCGIMVALETPRQVEADIGKALLSFSRDRDVFERKSANAANRIKTEYNWKIRGEQMIEIYEETLKRTDYRHG